MIIRRGGMKYRCYNIVYDIDEDPEEYGYKSLKALLKKLPGEMIIDVDPEEIEGYDEEDIRYFLSGEIADETAWDTYNFDYEIINEGFRGRQRNKLQEANDTKGLGVKVYMDFMNYRGEVNESVLIAAFKNHNWAKNFLKEVREEEDDTIRIRVVG